MKEIHGRRKVRSPHSNMVSTLTPPPQLKIKIPSAHPTSMQNILSAGAYHEITPLENLPDFQKLLARKTTFQDQNYLPMRCTYPSTS